MPISSAEAAVRPRPLLEVRGFAAGYGRALIVSGVDLDVGEGEVVAVVGPNGAGKSTLLKAIVGVISAMSGSVRFRLADVTRLSTDELARRGIGYVPQSRDVFDTLTVEENLKMGGYLLDGAKVNASMERVLATFPTLKPLLRRTAHKLSGGERKLVAVAKVMMLQPTLYLLDEPTSNLSVELAYKLLTDHVPRIAGTGAAVLIVEQKAKAALEVSQWAYLMVAGAISMSSPAAELLADESTAHRFLGKVEAATPGGKKESAG
jgi:ABC-type branched-subunit amino acid transport system ATPase component